MRKPPYRIWIGLMIFCAAILNNIFAGHFQISLLAIIDRSQRNTTQSLNVLQENYGPRYVWSVAQEGQLISAYSYGSTLSSFPSGILADFIGSFRIILASFILSTLFTCISVPLIGNNWIPLFVCRFFVGMCQGFIVPALLGIVAKWAPPNEKATFSSCILGYVFGSLFTPFCASFVIRKLGWQWCIYGVAVASFVFCCAWIVLVSDYPYDNWFCPKEEVEFINQSLEGAVQKGWVAPPFLRMLTSCPFIVLVVANFAVMAGLSIIYTMLPKFLSEALKFDLRKIGFIAPIPSIAKLLSGILFATFVEVSLKKWNIKKKYLRKGFTMFSHILPGMLFLTFLLSFVVEINEGLAVGILVLIMACTSGSVVTTLVNPQDLAPNYAATQSGITNFFGSMSGFIIPSMTAKITEEKSDIEEWSIVFAVVGSLYLITGIAFILFGSTNIQPWNEKDLKEQAQEQSES